MADLCCGPGTTLAAAAENDCRFLGVDLSPHAISVCRKRLLDTTLEIRTPFDRTDARLEADMMPGIGYYTIELKSFDAALRIPEGTVFHPRGLKVEGLDAVDQWSVGFLRDGAYKTYVSSARRKQSPELKTLLELPLLRGQVAISVVDVLGTRTLWAAEPDR